MEVMIQILIGALHIGSLQDLGKDSRCIKEL
jgi:hypothetical protein